MGAQQSQQSEQSEQSQQFQQFQQFVQYEHVDRNIQNDTDTTSVVGSDRISDHTYEIDGVHASTSDLIIYNRNNRAVRALRVKVVSQKLYILDHSTPIHVSDLSSALTGLADQTDRTDYMRSLIVLSDDMSKIVIPEVDPDTDRIVLVVYDIGIRLKYVRSCVISGLDCIVKVVGQFVHVIERTNNTYTRIVSYGPNDRISTTQLQLKPGIRRIRFSKNGSILACYDEYMELVRYTKSPQIIRHAEHIVDCFITDHSVYCIFQTDQNNQNTYYGAINTDSSNSKIHTICEISASSMLIHIDTSEYFGQNFDITADLSFTAKPTEFVVCAAYDNLGHSITFLCGFGFAINDGSYTHTHTYMLIGRESHRLQTDQSKIQIRDGTIFVSGAGGTNRYIAYDLTTMAGPIIAYSVSNLLKSQILHKISTHTDRSNITIAGADEKIITYSTSSPIIMYAVPDLSNINKIYQLCVNSNMDLLGSKSFIMFDRLCSTNKTDAAGYVYILFDSICKIESDYDRYQTVSELLDHFYDYIKFVLMGLSYTDESELPDKTVQTAQPDALYKKQSALMMAYSMLSIILLYYNREHRLSQARHKTKRDPVSCDIIRNFCHNFQPFCDLNILRNTFGLFNLHNPHNPIAQKIDKS